MSLQGTRSQTETRASPLLLLLLVLTATLCQSYNFTLKMFLVRCYREATEKKYKRVLKKKYLKVFFSFLFFPRTWKFQVKLDSRSASGDRTGGHFSAVFSSVGNQTAPHTFIPD